MEDILDIVNSYKLGCFTQYEIADAFDVNQQSVSRILTGKRYTKTTEGLL